MEISKKNKSSGPTKSNECKSEQLYERFLIVTHPSKIRRKTWIINQEHYENILNKTINCLKKKYCSYWESLLDYKSIVFVDEKLFERGKIPNRQNIRVYRDKSQKDTVPAILKHPKFTFFAVLIRMKNLKLECMLKMFVK